MSRYKFITSKATFTTFKPVLTSISAWEIKTAKTGGPFSEAIKPQAWTCRRVRQIFVKFKKFELTNIKYYEIWTAPDILSFRHMVFNNEEERIKSAYRNGAYSKTIPWAFFVSSSTCLENAKKNFSPVFNRDALTYGISIR